MIIPTTNQLQTEKCYQSLKQVRLIRKRQLDAPYATNKNKEKRLKIK